MNNKKQKISNWYLHSKTDGDGENVSIKYFILINKVRMFTKEENMKKQRKWEQIQYDKKIRCKQH